MFAVWWFSKKVCYHFVRFVFSNASVDFQMGFVVVEILICSYWEIRVLQKVSF